MNNKTEVLRSNHIEILKESLSNEWLIKFDVSILEDVQKRLKEDFGIEKRINSGVYFLCNDFEIYIGKSNDVLRRLQQHVDEGVKTIDTVTIAISNNPLDEFEENEIQALEALLIGNAKEENVHLINAKDERQRTYQHFNKAYLKQRALNIWRKFQMLNIENLISQYAQEMLEIEDKTNSFETTTSPAKVIINSVEKPKKMRGSKLQGVVVYEHDFEPNYLDEFFSVVNKLEFMPESYAKKDLYGFSPELAKTAFFMYFYEDVSAIEIESKLIPEASSPRGFILAKTMAAFRIATRGNRGVMRESGISESEAKELINDFIDSCQIKYR